MKKLYNICLVVLHGLGLFFSGHVCIARIVFYTSWPAKDDIIVWSVIGIAIIGHYLLIGLGHYKGIVADKTVFLLEKIERVFFWIQAIVLVLFYVVFWFRVPLGAVYPLVITFTVPSLLRYFHIKRLLK